MPVRGIPKHIFMTHPNDEDPQTIRDVKENVVSVGGMKEASVHFFDDQRMADSACHIAKELAELGVTGAWEAFAKLRPGAYRADLWRYMALWSHGGVYLDMDLRVNISFDSWLPFDSDRLVLVHDRACDGYWNAVMASPRRSPAMLLVIERIVQKVLAEEYGEGPLDITGPTALYKAVEDVRDEHVEVMGKAYRLTKCGRPHSLPPPLCGQRLMETDLVAVYTDDETQTGLHDAENYYSSLWAAGRVYCTEDDPCEHVRVCLA